MAVSTHRVQTGWAHLDAEQLQRPPGHGIRDGILGQMGVVLHESPLRLYRDPLAVVRSDPSVVVECVDCSVLPAHVQHQTACHGPGPARPCTARIQLTRRGWGALDTYISSAPTPHRGRVLRKACTHLPFPALQWNATMFSGSAASHAAASAIAARIIGIGGQLWSSNPYRDTRWSPPK